MLRFGPSTTRRGWRRVSVYVPGDLVLRIRHAAVEGGLSFSETLSHLLRKGVEAP